MADQPESATPLPSSPASTIDAVAQQQLSAEPEALVPANAVGVIGDRNDIPGVQETSSSSAQPPLAPSAAPVVPAEDASLLFVPEANAAHTEIHMCWRPSAFAEGDLAALYAEGRAGVESAIEASWVAHSWIRVRWSDNCEQGGIPVEVNDRRSSADRRGMVLNFTFVNYIPSCASSNVTAADATWTYCVRSLAVHEFGHVLGFDHEQNKSADGITCNDGGTRPHDVGNFLIKGNLPPQPIDTSSVMSYCQEGFRDTLSEGDIETVGALYGANGRHVESGKRYALRSGTQFARAFEDAGFKVLNNSSGIDDSFTLQRLDADALPRDGALVFGDRVRVLLGDEALCALDASPAGDTSSLVFTNNVTDAACTWSLHRNAEHLGDDIIDVNDPLTLVLASALPMVAEDTALIQPDAALLDAAVAGLVPQGLQIQTRLLGPF